MRTAPEMGRCAAEDFGNSGVTEDSTPPRLPQVLRSNADLERLTDDLETFADWRDGLAIQIKRAELLFELGLLDDSAREALERRVRLWCQAANTLAATLQDRRAAA